MVKKKKEIKKSIQSITHTSISPFKVKEALTFFPQIFLSCRITSVKWNRTNVDMMVKIPHFFSFSSFLHLAVIYFQKVSDVHHCTTQSCKMLTKTCLHIRNWSSSNEDHKCCYSSGQCGWTISQISNIIDRFPLVSETVCKGSVNNTIRFFFSPYNLKMISKNMFSPVPCCWAWFSWISEGRLCEGLRDT